MVCLNKRNKNMKEKVKVKESSTAGNVDLSALFVGVVQCFIWPCEQKTFLRVN